MSSFRSLSHWLVLVPVVLVLDAGAARAQEDSVVARVRHDQTQWLQALLKVEGDDQVRVEVPRIVIDPQSQVDIRVRERVRLLTPVFFPDSIDYARAEISHGIRTVQVPRPLPISQVFRLEARRDSRVAGALIGGAALGTVAITTGFAEACPPDQTTSCFGDFEMVARTLGGAALGALVGGFIGSRIKKWKTIYTVDPTPSTGLIHR